MDIVINILFVLGMIILIFFLTSNVISVATSFTDNAITRARIKRYQKGVGQADKSTKETIDGITSIGKEKILPLLVKVFPSLGSKRDKVQINRDLKFIGYDKNFTAESFWILSIILKIVGTIIAIFGLIVALTSSKGIIGVFFIVIGLIVAMFLDLDFASAIKAKKTRIMVNFADVIRVISSFLNTDISLREAVEKSIPYVDDEWADILQSFVTTSRNVDVSTALEEMGNTINVFEAREFISLVRLVEELGGKAKDSFKDQADKITEIQKNQYLLKINRRKTYAIILQAPSLLLIMVNFMLPMFMQSGSLMS